MSDYQGIKIYKRLIIVKNKKGQGYIVEEGNKSSLETAERWASWGEYVGTSFTYDNGNFDFELLDAAGGSNQGGKLSFWNCKITAPDNEEFIVGINSEIIKKFSEMDSRLSGGELRPLRLRKQRLENPPKETRTGRIRTRLPVTRADSSHRTTALTSPI